MIQQMQMKTSLLDLVREAVTAPDFVLLEDSVVEVRGSIVLEEDNSTVIS